jgi:hypothetical protein
MVQNVLVYIHIFVKKLYSIKQLQAVKQPFNLPQVTDLVSMYRRGSSSRRRMLQRDTRRPAALHKLNRRGVASLAVGVVVGDREDDRGNPDKR